MQSLEARGWGGLCTCPAWKVLHSTDQLLTCHHMVCVSQTATPTLRKARVRGLSACLFISVSLVLRIRQGFKHYI